MKPNRLVKQLLGEEDPATPVPAAAAPAPEPQLKVYKAVKSDDLELSNTFHEYLGEASNDGSTISVGDLEYIADHQETFQAEIKGIIAQLEAAGADLIILT